MATANWIYGPISPVPGEVPPMDPSGMTVSPDLPDIPHVSDLPQSLHAEPPVEEPEETIPAPAIAAEPKTAPAPSGALSLDRSDGYTRIGQHTSFAVNEAYKTIRTNLLFSLVSQDSKVVVVSSALPGEGKSTTCCNLAISMAQTDARVLLIDADMRKPVQHKIFKQPNRRGLADLLGGFCSLNEVVMPKVAAHLDFIPAGTIPPNPSELLGSGRMQRFLQSIDGLYDYVFIDSPPVGTVSDPVILASIAAGVILVTRQGYCTYDDLSQAVERVSFAKANVLGVVVNGARAGKGAGKRRKYYRYGYGEAGPDKK